MLFQQSDEEFIARIEKSFKSRKKTGLFLLLVSVVMIGAAGYFLNDLGGKILSVANSVANVSTESLKDEAQEASMEFALLMGATLGMTIAGAFLGGIHILMQALYLLFGSRQEQLLINYSKRVKEGK